MTNRQCNKRAKEIIVQFDLKDAEQRDYIERYFASMFKRDYIAAKVRDSLGCSTLEAYIFIKKIAKRGVNMILSGPSKALTF